MLLHVSRDKKMTMKCEFGKVGHAGGPAPRRRPPMSNAFAEFPRLCCPGLLAGMQAAREYKQPAKVPPDIKLREAMGLLCFKYKVLYSSYLAPTMLLLWFSMIGLE